MAPLFDISFKRMRIRDVAPLFDIRSLVSGYYSKQPYLGLTQESLRMVTARVLVVLGGSFTSQIETGLTLT